MTTIHTIKLANDRTDKRTSESRKYVACIVATTTEASVRIATESKEKAERALAGHRVELAEAMAKHGMTVEQAVAWEKATVDKWFGDEANKITKAVYEANRDSHGFYGDRLHAAYDAARIKAGFVNPFDEASPHAICTAAHNVSVLERNLEGWKAPVVGSQYVISWHGSVPLARKALGNRECTAIAARGAKLEVRTDIETRETAKRAPKA